jgi:hypothetical protein
MSESNSTATAGTGKPAKPSKPRPDFPLTAHPAGYWCKKIRGKVHAFGPWDDPDGALVAGLLVDFRPCREHRGFPSGGNAPFPIQCPPRRHQGPARGNLVLVPKIEGSPKGG